LSIGIDPDNLNYTHIPFQDCGPFEMSVCLFHIL